MYLTKTPSFIQSLFPNFTWKIPSSDRKIFLTFDDGPIPAVTEWVLELLAEYQAHGTFFCVGENVAKYPHLFHRIKTEGHATGNHTYHHKNGWHTDNLDYFHDIRKCAQLVKSNLFRPPYGKLKPKQAQFLQRHYKIIMWDILTGDFDTKLDPEVCFQNIVKKTKPGSILVFHDSVKAQPILSTVLPRVLTHFSALGYQFDSLDESHHDLKVAHIDLKEMQNIG